MLLSLLAISLLCASASAQVSAANSVLAAGADVLREAALGQARSLLSALPAAERRGVDTGSASAMLHAVVRSEAARTNKAVRAALARAVRRIEPASVECVLLGASPPAFVAPQEFYGARAVYQSNAGLDSACRTNNQDAPPLDPLPPAIASLINTDGVEYLTVQTTFDTDLAMVLTLLDYSASASPPTPIEPVRGALLPALVAPIVNPIWESVGNILPAPFFARGAVDATVTAIGSTCETADQGAFNPTPLDLVFALSREPVAGDAQAGLCLGAELQELTALADRGVVVGKVYLDTNRDGVRQPTEVTLGVSETEFLVPVIFSRDGGTQDDTVALGSENGDFIGIYTTATTQPAIGLRTTEARLDDDGFVLVPEVCGDADPRLAVTPTSSSAALTFNVLVSTVLPRNEQSFDPLIIGFVPLDGAFRTVSISFGVHCVGETPNRDAAPIAVEPLCGAEQLALDQEVVVDSFRVTATRRQAFAEFQSWLVAASIGDAPIDGASPLAPTVTTNLPSNVDIAAEERVTEIAARRDRATESLTGGGPPDELITFTVEVRTPYASIGQRCPGLAGAALRNELLLKSHSLSGAADGARLGSVGGACVHAQAPECTDGAQLPSPLAPRRDGAYIAAFTAFSLVVACVCCALSAGGYRARSDIKRF